MDTQRRRFYWLGCSHTTGMELTNPEKDRYSALTSNMFNAEEYNYSHRGDCNFQILQRCLDKIQEPVDLVLIQWSFFSRNITFTEQENSKLTYSDKFYNARNVRDYNLNNTLVRLPGANLDDESFMRVWRSINSYPRNILEWLNYYYAVVLHFAKLNTPCIQWFGCDVKGGLLNEEWKLDYYYDNGSSPIKGYTLNIANHPGYKHFKNNENFLNKHSNWTWEGMKRNWDLGEGGHYLEDAQVYWANYLKPHIERNM